eukprot:6265793-Pyramimonas_sp.AAC.1
MQDQQQHYSTAMGQYAAVQQQQMQQQQHIASVGQSAVGFTIQGPTGPDVPSPAWPAAGSA